MVGGAGGELDVHQGGHGQPPRGRDGTEAAQPARRARAGESQLFDLTCLSFMEKKLLGDCITGLS